MFAIIKRLIGSRDLWTDTGIRYEHTSTERVLRERRASKGFLVCEILARDVPRMTEATHVD